MEQFELTENDEFAIGIAKRVARRFLTDPRITPQQIVGLGRALYALERMPLVTPGSFGEFGICYRWGSESSGEMKYLQFHISSVAFEITQGGSTYSDAVGGDSYSELCWSVEVGGYRCDDCNISELEEIIEEYLSLGAEIAVYDGSHTEEQGERSAEEQ